MSLVCTPSLLNDLSGNNLLIDTCTIIDASKCDAVYNFLMEIKNHQCTLVSIPAVKEEFLCSANNLSEYSDLLAFYDALGILPLDKIMHGMLGPDSAAFDIALSRCKNIKPSHVDRILLSVPYHYRNAPEKMFLITSNHKDVPDEFFARVGFITHDIGGFHNIGVYRFIPEKFDRMMHDVSLAQLENLIKTGMF